MSLVCHCEERSDEAISISVLETAWVPQRGPLRLGALRSARNDLEADWQAFLIPSETLTSLLPVRVLIPDDT